MLTRRSLLIVTTLLLLMTELMAGCGTEASTNTPTVSLSPEGVVMVNGKELTKADLADELTLVQMTTPQQRKDSGFAAEMPKPGTPEYAELETGLVRSVIWKEIHIQEAESRGLGASEAEIKKQLDDAIKASGGEAAFNQTLAEINKTLDWDKEQNKDAVLIRKVQEAVKNEAPAGADEIETELNKNDAYWTWFTNRRNQSDILYADQYRPSSPDSHYSVRLAKTLFYNRCTALYEYENMLSSKVSEVWNASQSYAGLTTATSPILQRLDKMQVDLAAKAQALTGEPRKIADQIVQVQREYIDTHRKQIAAGEANDMDAWRSLNDDVFNPLNKRLDDLYSQWHAVRA